MYTVDNALVEKWEPVLEGVQDDYTKRVTAQLLENQAKAIISERLGEVDEAFETGSSPTTVGKLGTFQKFAFPLVRRVYPKLIANSIVGVQPMQGPVSQIFYLGNTRVGNVTAGGSSANSLNQPVYSKFQMTYRGFQTSSIFGGANLDADQAAAGEAGESTLGNLLSTASGSPSTTIGGKIAAFPDETKIYGWTVSGGERLSSSAIPEINFHIEQQPVAARTRKMRALWTLEAQQDLKAYHNLDLERELTDLLGKELALEIDRELIEDLRMLAYDLDPGSNDFGGFNRRMLDNPNSNAFKGMDFGNTDGTDFTYDFSNQPGDPKGTLQNVFMIDFTSSALDFAPQHVGHVYANLLAVINLASQDIYKSTWRGPGSWLLCAPLVASLLESAAKLEGGLPAAGGPTNMGNTSIEYKGKFAGKYDLYVDPLYPEDEIMVGYKGANAMDAGYVYAPYIPMQQLPTITDPLTFQPRKGILTRYGKAIIQPGSRFYRIIRIIGPVANYLYTPFVKGVNESPVHTQGPGTYAGA